MIKYNNKSNSSGSLKAAACLKKNMSQEDVCKKLQLLDINIDRVRLYCIEKSQVILKDFELVFDS